MGTGAVIGNIDLAQLVLYGFWIFFFGLIYYLRQEDRREGYPLHSEERGAGASPAFFFIPEPKTFDLPHGGTATAPNFKLEQREIKIEKHEVWPGAPFVPTGDPMLDGVGPAAWTERADIPDVTMEGHTKIVPLRIAPDFAPFECATDPRGFDVTAGDGAIVGKVSDLWVDRSEQLVRYLEVELADGGRRVLVPMVLASVTGLLTRRYGPVVVSSIYGVHFQNIPATASPDQVTLLEEDKIQAYVSSGNLYRSGARGAVAVSPAYDHDDFDFEPIPGLPANLPEGEHILWQGTPRWRGLAKHALHLPLVALYCAILLGWVVVDNVAGGASWLSAFQALTLPGSSVAALFVILTGLAYSLARSTIYTITNRRVMMRFGVVLPITINLPFKRIETAALKHHGDDTGDIPLTLKGRDRIAWLHLWPHARPFRFSKPEPMLRDVPEVDRVAALLAKAMAEELPEGRATLAKAREQEADAADNAGLATA